MIVCPNTSPLIVLARLEQLDLLGDPGDIRLMRAVRDEIQDKQDEVAEPLGPGERSVLSYALTAGPGVLCVLDDTAARAEARRLGVSFTGTLGLVLRAKAQAKVSHAALRTVGEVWPG